ncbi:hypothetical protein MY4038_009862 [Beauveria bassiana]|uniref:Transcription factor ste11 n=1 Tax=Beauveria bassiana TaxID=176275 RepID=A0A2N6NH47_BEABA|nr:Transcription factor ste11 [Beauveria bassiana]
MSPSPSSRPSTLPMKTREIPSYASNHILRAPQIADMGSGYAFASSSGVHSVPQHNRASASESGHLISIDSGNAMTRISHRPVRDVEGHRSQSKERRIEKRNLKTPPSACLTKALSEIAHDMPSISVADVATFANRSTEVRQMEAAKAGKVKRPLNAFMLYRKAYQDVAKTQCSRNNHQQVSTICGSSWNGWEPPNIIAQFKQLASIEKQMHEGAFPAYKYDPVQTKKPKDGIEQDYKTCELSDGESSCRPRRSGRQRTTRATSRVKQSFTLEVPDQYRGLSGTHSQPPGGTWQQYQALPFPDWYMHGGLPADAPQYAPRGEQRADNPDAGVAFGCTSSDLQFQGYTGFVDPCLDPSLQTDVPASQYNQFLGSNHDMLPGWMSVGGAQNASTALVPELDITGAHTAYLQGTPSDWQVEQLEDGSHFSDWMTQAGNGEHQ